MIGTSTALQKSNLRNILALFQKQMLLHKSIGSNVGIDFIAHLILHPLKDGRCAFYRSIDHRQIIDFYLCILFISKISPHLKTLEVPSKGNCSRRCILELSQPFEYWFELFGKPRQEKKSPYFDQLKDHIALAQNTAVHNLFREEPQKISSIVSRLNNFLHSLPYKTFPSTWKHTALLRHKEIPIEIIEPYNAIISRTNRIQNDVENIIKHTRKKQRPKLNFHTKDDTIQYDAISNLSLQANSQEAGTTDRRVYDGSETSEESDTNNNHKNNRGTQIGTDSYDSEDDVTFDSQVIDNIAEGFTYIFSLEDEDESASEWDIISEPVCEWEVMSDVQSVHSYGENEFIFTYKDAVQVLTNSASVPSTPSKVNMLHNAMESPSFPRTYPTPISATKVTSEEKDEEKHDEDNAEFDAYFEYDAYKGGRGGKSFRRKRISNSKTRNRF